ncbi:MAG: hypothetical protein QOJ04_3631 [Caballeronia sp.]|jgi:hypothetical protein|nr:hypothetical protein [Caballeronia sp.]MEA3114289.1 hypothetical protein [Caballeronia sp.]
MKSFERLLRCAACVTLKRSLSMSCEPLLKQLIRVKVCFECFLPVLSDNFVTL